MERISLKIGQNDGVQSISNAVSVAPVTEVIEKTEEPETIDNSTMEEKYDVTIDLLKTEIKELKQSKDRASIEVRAELNALENNILLRIKEYERCQEALENEQNIIANVESIEDINTIEESPFVRALKEKLINTHNELKEVRNLTTIQLGELKIALEMEKRSLKTANDELTAKRIALAKSTAYVKQSKEMIITARNEVAVKDNQITELKKLIEEKSKKTTINNDPRLLQQNSELAVKFSNLFNNHQASFVQDV